MTESRSGYPSLGPLKVSQKDQNSPASLPTLHYKGRAPGDGPPTAPLPSPWQREGTFSVYWSKLPSFLPCQTLSSLQTHYPPPPTFSLLGGLLPPSNKLQRLWRETLWLNVGQKLHFAFPDSSSWLLMWCWLSLYSLFDPSFCAQLCRTVLN